MKVLQKKLDIIDKENDLELNQEFYDEEEKRRKLYTQDKILEQKVHGQTKKKHDKELQQEALKTARYEKKHKLVQEVAEAKEANEERKQDIFLTVSKLNPNIKIEDIDDEKKFHEDMFQTRIALQHELETLNNQHNFVEALEKKGSERKKIKTKIQQQGMNIFAENPEINKIAEQDLNLASIDDKIDALPEVISAVNKKLSDFQMIEDGDRYRSEMERMRKEVADNQSRRIQAEQKVDWFVSNADSSFIDLYNQTFTNQEQEPQQTQQEEFDEDSLKL